MCNNKIKFLKRFIPNYALIVKPIKKLLRKDQDFEWTPEAQRAFANIKSSIVSYPDLVRPNFHNHFILYSFDFEDNEAVVLTQKNQKGENFPISLIIKELHDYELRYS